MPGNKEYTCVMCSSATRSKVNRDSGWQVQVMLWPLSCLTHLFSPCTDISLLLSGRTRITTCGTERLARTGSDELGVRRNAPSVQHAGAGETR